MGKLLNKLNKQVELGIQVSDAKDCLKLYSYLKEINNGKVWKSQWNTLVNLRFDGKYPYIYVYNTTILGKKVLLGLGK